MYTTVYVFNTYTANQGRISQPQSSPLLHMFVIFYCPLVVSYPYFWLRQLNVFLPPPGFGMIGADNPVTASTGSC